MELRTSDLRTGLDWHPVAPCAQCGRTMFGPEWSERPDDHRILHLWACEACGYRFETLVFYPPVRNRA